MELGQPNCAHRETSHYCDCSLTSHYSKSRRLSCSWENKTCLLLPLLFSDCGMMSKFLGFGGKLRLELHPGFTLIVYYNLSTVFLHHRDYFYQSSDAQFWEQGRLNYWIIWWSKPCCLERKPQLLLWLFTRIMIRTVMQHYFQHINLILILTHILFKEFLEQYIVYWVILKFYRCRKGFLLLFCTRNLL